MPETEAMPSIAQPGGALKEGILTSKDDLFGSRRMEYQWDQASASTASGTLSLPCSLPTTPDASRSVQEELASLCRNPLGKAVSVEAVVVEEPSSRGESESEAEAYDPADLPSKGSAGHASGTCSRCCFHPKGRCTNGYNCEFCHFDHDKRKRKKKKKKNLISDVSTTDTGVALGEFMRVEPVTSFPRSGLPWSTQAGVPAFIPEPSWHHSYSSEFVQKGAYRVDAYGTVTNGSYGAPADVSGFCSQQYMGPAYPTPNYECPQFPQQMVNLGADVRTWSITMIADWLVASSLGDLVVHFDAHRITGDVLLDLTNEDLQEMGVLAMGDRKRILRAIALLPRADAWQQIPTTVEECQSQSFTTPSLPAERVPPPPPTWHANEGLQENASVMPNDKLPDLISHVDVKASQELNQNQSDGLPEGWTLRDLLPS